MPVTILDPGTALLVIDLQNGILALPTLHPGAAIVAKAGALAHAFRHHGLPVVLVTVTGVAPGRTEQTRRFGPFPEGFADIAAGLDRQKQDYLVTKQTRDAFTGTDLEAHLKALGVTQIVIAGIATSSGVESTARHAHDLGFHVTFAVDAMTDADAAAHEHSIKRIFPKLGETGTTQDIIDLLSTSRG